MKVFRAGDNIAIRLDMGEDVLTCVRQAAAQEGIHTGVVVSGIGTLRRAHLHMVTTTGLPAVEVHPTWEDTPMELLALSGIVAGGEPHLHVVLSDEHHAFGGHLEEGCETLYLCEIVLQSCPGLRLARRPDADNLMKLEEA